MKNFIPVSTMSAIAGLAFLSACFETDSETYARQFFGDTFGIEEVLESRDHGVRLTARRCIYAIIVFDHATAQNISEDGLQSVSGFSRFDGSQPLWPLPMQATPSSGQEEGGDDAFANCADEFSPATNDALNASLSGSQGWYYRRGGRAALIDLENRVAASILYQVD